MPATAIPAPQAKEIMPALTGLRFLLAALVMLYHVGAKQMADAPWWIANIVSRGYLAVNAFFILSGFVLAHSYLNPEGRLRGGLKNFWIARFARIYPVYALTVVLSFPNRFHYGLNHPTGWEDAVASLTVLALLQAWIPAFALLIDSAAWSLSAEAFFYLSFPALSKLARNRRWQGLICLILGCWILCLTPPAICLIAPASLLSRDWFAAFIQYNPLFHVPAFVMGIATQRLFLLARSGPLVNSWYPAAISGLSIGAIGIVLAGEWPIPRVFIHNGLLGVAFAALIFGLATGRGVIAGVLSHPVFTLLGEASYSLYLTHLPLWALTTAVYTTARLSVSSWGFLTVDCVIAIAISILTLKYVETPYRISISASLRGMKALDPIAATVNSL